MINIDKAKAIKIKIVRLNLPNYCQTEVETFTVNQVKKSNIRLSARGYLG